MELLCRTFSLSPLTNRKIPAEIWRDGDDVVMLKTDEEGTKYRARIDNDYEIWRRLHSPRVYTPIPFKGGVIYYTSICNLHCPLCYEAEARIETPELSNEDLEAFVSRYQGQFFVLGGREPTARDDFPDAIRIVSNRNGCLTLTNGLRLEDPEYVQQCKDAGWHEVIFQLFGFKEEANIRIAGRPLNDIKMKALANLKAAGMNTRLSCTVARGVNEDQMKPLLEYAAKNTDFVRTMTFRSATPFGRHVDAEQITISDFVKMLCRDMGWEIDHLLNELELHRAIALNLKGAGAWLPKTCSFLFHIRLDSGGRWYPIGRDIDPSWLKTGALARPSTLAVAAKVLGPRFFYDHLTGKKSGKITKVPGATRVFLKGWPTIFNIDLVEMNKCTTGYYRRRQWEPFCVTNVLETNMHQDTATPRDDTYVRVFEGA